MLSLRTVIQSLAILVVCGLCVYARGDGFKVGPVEIDVKPSHPSINLSVPGGSGVQVDPMGVTTRVLGGTIYQGTNGVAVTMPGGGTASADGSGNILVDIPGVGRGTYNSNTETVDIPGIGSANKREVRDREGKLLFKLAPDGKFMPANVSDEDWFLAFNPSVKNLEATYDTDRDDVNEILQSLSIVVIYGAEIDWEEYQKLAIALGQSVAGGNPGPIINSILELNAKMVDTFRRNATREAQIVAQNLTQSLLMNLLNQSVITSSPVISSISGIKVRVGFNTYYHSKVISFDNVNGRRIKAGFTGPNTHCRISQS